MQSRPDSHPPKRRQVSPGRLPGRSRHHGAPEGDAGAGGGKRTPFAGGRGRGRGRRDGAAGGSRGSGRGGSRRFSEPLGTLPRSAPPAVPSYGLRKRKACDYGESDDPSEEEEEEEVEVQRPMRDDHRRDTVRGGARTLMAAAAPSSRGRSEGRGARDEGGAKAALPSRSLRSNSLPGGSHPGVKVEEEEDGSGEGEGEEDGSGEGEEEEEEEESEEEVGCVC